MKIVFFILLNLYLVGCVSLNTVSLTSIPAQREKPVSASVERFMVLGFNFDNDYVDMLTDKLKNQCNNGTISGILTKDENIDYFLYIFWKKTITAKGYCVQNKNVSSVDMNKKTKRNPSEVNSNDTEEVLTDDIQE